MKVALLRALPLENWRSIKVYANGLTQGLRKIAPEIKIVDVKVQAWDWPRIPIPTPYRRPASLHTLGIYLSRWVLYPLAIRKLDIDIFHILDNSYGHLAYFTDPNRTVVTSHGGTPQSLNIWNPKGPAMWLFQLAFRGMLRAARVITVSEYAKKELLTDSTYPANHIHVVHHGVDPAFHPYKKEKTNQLRDKLLPSSGHFLLLHVGHNAARKNVELLYQAMSLLHRAGYRGCLVCIGSLPTASQTQLIQSLHLNNFITHIPHINHQELPAYYNAADIFVFPSLYEGFGVPVIEAMACGTPVIASNVSSLPEVVGPAGLLVDPRSPQEFAEAIQRVLKDKDLAFTLRQRGLERAQNFTWEKTAQKTLEVYQTILT
ncbi:MAG: glycosyltransferase family 1 protein [Chloroflexota bacterium]